MSENSATLHEATDDLSREVRDRHRALVSLGEELEAIDWYAQRAEATSDPELRGILEHNRREEIEHATMLVEWLRRHDPVWERELRARLFSEGDIVEDEPEPDPGHEVPDLGLGALEPPRKGGGGR